MMKEQSFGASFNRVSDWEAVDWPKVWRDVRRLQLRFAKAIRAGKWQGKGFVVAALCALLLKPY